MNLVEKLLTYYKENTVDFVADIEELDDWNDCLYEDRILPMEDLNDVCQGISPHEILQRAFYGYDEPTDKYEKCLPFNPSRNYFYFNVCGNLVSIDEKDYTSYLDEEFIQEIIDKAASLVLSDGAQKIIDKYEGENEDQ